MDCGFLTLARNVRHYYAVDMGGHMDPGQTGHCG